MRRNPVWSRNRVTSRTIQPGTTVRIVAKFESTRQNIAAGTPSIPDGVRPSRNYSCAWGEIQDVRLISTLHSGDDDTSFVITFHFVKIGIAPLARKPTLSRHLRDARIRRGLSVAEVAEQAGVSVASIYLWETGKTHPRDANLSALCKVLKLPIRATRELAAG
jgi:DNA-binding XRE family transcriptional regulator